jgi:arachidonate 15-lipoxygenase
MSREIKATIKILYRFINFLSRFPFARWFILTNKYEYDYKILPPLAMTYVPSNRITNLPKLPKQDEIPNPKWIALVVNVITVGLLTQKEKSTNLIDKSVPTHHKINCLNSINDEMKAATETEELNNSVGKMLTVLELENENKLEDKANIKETYTHLKKILKYDIELLEKELNAPESELGEMVKTPTSNVSLQNYEKLIQPLSIKPETVNNFQQDHVFAYMQVAGPNPVMLHQIKQIDYRLPITQEQYQQILPQDNFTAALEQGRIYLADYSKLEALTNGNFGGLQKYIYAPVALFAVPPEDYSDRYLRPIAIRCQHTPGDKNPIFTPLDGENWMTAKTILQMADSNYHELISHLAQTHLFIEPFVLATNRCFTNKNHPLRLLLKPHLEGTILINYGAHKRLLAPAGPIDSLLSGSIGSNCQLAIKEALNQLANFNEVAFPRTLEKRGVNNSQQLPIYPYREDGQKIWDAIHQWVKEYLGLFYSSDTTVQTDQQLKNWAEELFSKGNCHIGEQSDGQIKTLNYLIEAISTIIFTASAQHAAVNFPQSGLMTYVPAFPLGCYSPAPTQTQQQQNFINFLPNIERSELQVKVLSLLGSIYYTELGDYSGAHFQNLKVKIALDKFQLKLREIEQTILREDSQRLVSYRYLLPSKIPQSINI